MNKSRTDIDRLFEKGISDVERTPRKTLSEAEISAAAAASKSGAGVFLRSHTKEIILCLVSLAAICLITFTVLRFSTPKSPEPQADTTIISEDTVAISIETPDTAVETVCTPSLRTDNPDTPSENPRFGTTKHLSNVPSQTSHVPSQTSHVSDPAPDAPTANSQLLTPNSPEPVVVKKTIVKRDTVHVRESVTIKDTVYLMDN